MTSLNRLFITGTFLILTLATTTVAQEYHTVGNCGIVAKVPVEWSFYRSMVTESEYRISFGLPDTLDSLTQRSIENDVTIFAYREESINNVQDTIDFATTRKRDIIVTHSPVTSERGAAFQVISEYGGHRYKGQCTYFYENGIGYNILFNATEGTYDINLPRYLEFVANLKFSSAARPSLHPDDPDPSLGPPPGQPRFYRPRPPRR